MTLTLRRRVLLTQLPLALLLIVLGYGGSVLLGQLGSRINAILRENYDSVVAMQRLNEGLERIDSSFQFALAGREAPALDQYRDNWRYYDESLRAEQGNVTLPGEREAVERLTTLTGLYREEGDAFYAQVAGDPSRSSDYFGPTGLLHVFTRIKETSAHILRMNEDSMEQASRDAKATATQSHTALAAMLALTAALAGLAAWSTIRATVAPVVAITRATEAISAGDLDQTVPHSSPDELGKLGQVFNDMVQRLRASRRSVEERTAELVRANEQLAEQIREREGAEQKYRSIFENAIVGIFQTTPAGRYIDVNTAMAHLLGYTSATELVTAVKDIGQELYMDPARRVAFREALAESGSVSGFEAEYLRKDGSTIWLSFTARSVRDQAGALAFYEGFAVDITARRLAEQQVMRLAELHAVAADLGQRALRLDSSAALQEASVKLVAKALGVDFCNVMELLPGGEAFALRAGVGWKEREVTVPSEGSQPGYTVRAQHPVVVENVAEERLFVPVAAHMGETVESTMSVAIVTSEGAYGTLGAHSRRRRAFTKDEVDFLQTVAAVLGADVERRRAEVRQRRMTRAYRALSNCNELLIRADDEASWIREVCRIIVEQAGYRMCWVGFAEHDESRTVRPVAQAGADEGYLGTVNITWADTERGRGPTGTCIRTRTTTISRNIDTDPRLAPWRAQALRRGYASSIALPLLVQSESLGALTIYSAERDAFGDEEVSLLTELTGDLAYGITTLRTRGERARAQEDLRALNAQLEQRVIARTTELRAARDREVEVGFRIQRMLLLDRPPEDVPGLCVAALTIPSQEIGGDSYGFLYHENHCLDLFVADVMGKGIPAALLSAAARSYFPEAMWHLMSAAHPGELPEPRDLVALAHAHMARELIELESFVTLCYARFDRRARRLVFVDCGHTGVLHVEGRTGRCSIVHGTNAPLGVIEGELFDEVSLPFETGDAFLFFSDGVTEARDVHGSFFGAERLVECVRDKCAVDAAALVEAVRAAVAAFSGSPAPRDDLTCVVVQIVEYESPLASAELDLASDLAQLRRAREFVRTFCLAPSRSLLDPDATAALELAVDEAVSNIIKHAYAGRSDEHIRLSAEAFLGHVDIRLRHVGRAFDAAAVVPPALDGSRESGFGVYLIRECVDAVCYRRDELGRNCIDLRKNRAAALRS